MPHLRFGDCEIDLARRELRLGGRLQALPPKAYAVLLLLIEQRDRVVGRDELLRSVWGRETLSPSVPGRTVMLVRRAIGDSAAQPRWIQSLHGVGYRFIGQVQQSGTVRTQAPAAATALPPRLAVLPCENLTEEAALAWVDVGLMALVGRALAGQPGIEMVPPTQLLDSISHQPGAPVPAEQAWHAMDLLGATAVVHGRLGRQGPALWLDYRLFRRGADTLAGSLRGDDVVALADRLALQLVQALQPDHDGPLAAGRSDPFIAQAWARACELHGQGDCATALPLLDVVCRHDPHDEEAALLRLQCGLQLQQPDAAAQGAALLAHAAQGGRERLRARTLALLAGSRAGRAHLADALQAAAPFAEEDWALELGLAAAARARDEGDLATARARLDDLEATCARRRRMALAARVQVQTAALDLSAGSLAEARDRLELAVATERRLHRRSRLAEAQALLACVHVAQGQLDQATALADEVLDMARAGAVGGQVLPRLLRVYRERLQPDRLRGVRALLEPGAHAARQAAEACLMLAQGELPAARDLLRGALDAGTGLPPLPVADAWLPLWLRLERACGERAALACALRTAAGTRFQHHPLLAAAALHDSATAAWGAGDLAGAHEALSRMAVALPAGREQACACTDLAWCAIEQGDLTRAAMHLSGLGPWLRQHPVGMAAQARLLLALGCAADAEALQARALALHAGAGPLLQRALHRHYADCAAGRTAGPLPLPPLLPSDAWLPLPAAVPVSGG